MTVAVEMKCVFADPDDPTLVFAMAYPAAASIAQIANWLKTMPGVGQPFYAFSSIPPQVETNIAADFTDAPIVSNSIAENESAINAMLQDTSLQELPNGQVFTAT